MRRISQLVAARLLFIAIALIFAQTIALISVVHAEIARDAFLQAKSAIKEDISRLRSQIEGDYAVFFAAYGENGANYSAMEKRAKQESLSDLAQRFYENEKFAFHIADISSGDTLVSSMDYDITSVPCRGGECLLEQFVFEPWKWRVSIVGDPSRYEQNLLKTQLTVAAIGVLTVLLFAICLYFAIRSQIYKPLRLILQNLNDLSDEEYSSPIKINSNLEMNTLFDRVNFLSSKLREHADEIAERRAQYEKLITELESRVSTQVLQNIDEQKLFIRSSRIAAIGEMLGMIAHHWRQPLNRVGLIAQDLRDRYFLGDFTGEQMRNSTREIMQELAAITATIDNFSTFYARRPNAGRFLIDDELTRTIALVQAELDNRAIKIEVNGFNSKVFVFGDPLSFDQAIMHIVNNAKDAIIRRKINGGKISIDCRLEGDRAKITIGDNGGGIAAEIIEHIFDPFFSTKEAGERANAIGGAGIGLYLSKFVIEDNLKGTIGVENVEHGAKFTIELPIVVIVS
ncbi:hypothetical protein FACS189487_08380 [Campylobacterota bacterium]|nr:hypothetical protein FACS189487_08380 [Campylobacterota bacterium]